MAAAVREAQNDGDTEAGIRALWPPADSNYRMCATDGGEVLETSLDLSTCCKETYDAYVKQIAELYGAEKKASSINGDGLFVTKDGPTGKYIVEYTGIRCSGASRDLYIAPLTIKDCALMVS